MQEGSRPNELGYHFTDIEGFLKIINSDGGNGLMKATNPPVGGDANRIIYVPYKDGDYVKTISTSKFDKFEKIKSGENPSPDLRYKKLSGNHLEALRNKKSWSYTRRKQGMSYRNFQTFDENTVCIVIDVDKISERQKIVPFTWNTKSHQKSGANFEYEERVIGDTKNFNRFIKKVFFKQELNLSGFNEDEEDEDNQVADYSIAYLESLDEFIDAKKIEDFCLKILKYNFSYYSGGNFYNIFSYSKDGSSIYKEFNIKSILYENGNTNKELIRNVEDKIDKVKLMLRYVNKLNLLELSKISENDIDIDEGIEKLRKSNVELIFLDKSRKSPIDFNKALNNYIQNYNKDVIRINSTFKKFKEFIKSDKVFEFLKNQLNEAPSLIKQAKKDLDSLKDSESRKAYENFMKDYNSEVEKLLNISGLKPNQSLDIENKYGELVFIKNKSKSMLGGVYGHPFSKQEFDEFMEDKFNKSIPIKDESIKIKDLLDIISEKVKSNLSNPDKNKSFTFKFSVYDMNADYDEELVKCELGIEFSYDSKLDSYLPKVKSSAYKTHS